MTKTITLRDSGIEIPQSEFGAIFGGGVKKGKAEAREEINFIAFGDANVAFTLDDMTTLQSVMSMIYREHQIMQSMLNLTDEQVVNLKPRIRVKAGRAPFLNLVEPSMASRIGTFGIKEPVVVSRGRRTVYDYTGMTPEEIAAWRKAKNKAYQAEYAKKSRKKAS